MHELRQNFSFLPTMVDARLGRTENKSRALLPLGDRIASAAVAVYDALIG